MLFHISDSGLFVLYKSSKFPCQTPELDNQGPEGYMLMFRLASHV